MTRPKTPNFRWTPDELTALRRAWRERASWIPTAFFDANFASTRTLTPRTVQRKRIALGLKSPRAHG